jgi:hypothetical protein
MEADVARLTEKTEAHDRALADVWKILQEAHSTSSKLDLILYRLDEQKTALTAHDLAETQRNALHETRISALETHNAEQKGMWKTITAMAATVGAVFGAAAAATLNHFLFGGK